MPRPLPAGLYRRSRDATAQTLEKLPLMTTNVQNFCPGDAHGRVNLNRQR